MTIKALADKLGVNKEKIKYLYRQLPEHMYVMVENRVILSDAAVDAIKNRLNGGELTSEIPVPPYNAVNPVGWGIDENTENNGESGENSSESSEYFGDSPVLSGETRLKSGDSENGETVEICLTIIDHYKSVVDVQSEQLSVKDKQLQRLTELAAAAEQTAAEQLKAKDVQLTAKDAQLSRMQDTLDTLTKQLADAAERERQLQAAIDQSLEQSRKQPRRWWQWWKQ